MKKFLSFILSILFIFLIGCSNKQFSNNYINSIEGEKCEFFGTWQIEGINSYSNIEDVSENFNGLPLVGEVIQINANNVNISGGVKSDIKYKLKVVGKNYVLSYENNLTIESFMNNKESVDVISVIHDNKILGEFFLPTEDTMILVYRSLVLNLKRISSDVDFDKSNNITSTESNEHGHVKEGVMLGIKTPRKIDEYGEYYEEKYRTIWISYNDGTVESVYEKDDIIFPRLSGIWKLSLNENVYDGKHFDELEVSSLDNSLITEESDKKVEKQEYKSIKFVGNDYIAIEKYVGNNFQNKYPIYQIIPIDHINLENGVQINELYNSDAKMKYYEAFKKNVVSIPDEQKGDIDYSSITMERDLGKWVLKGRIPSKNSESEGYDFDLPIKPNKMLINYNYLHIPWKVLKGELTFFKDAFTSPYGEFAIIQYDEYLCVYNIESGLIEGSPLFMIPINEDDEIIMAEWSSDIYVDLWEKVFLDGTKIE